MTSIELRLSGAGATAIVHGVLTRGMVGVPVHMVWDESWEGLSKSLVCKNDTVERVLAGVGADTKVAPEVLAHVPQLHAARLYLGVEGCNGDGTVVLPTVWADCGPILPAVDSSVDPSIEPEAPAWAKALARIGELASLKTESKENLVSAINELYSIGGSYYTPSVSQTGENTMEVSFMASNEEMPAVESVEITLPSGSGGSGGSVDADALAAALLTAIPTWEGGDY